MSTIVLLSFGAAGVGILHSVLPDHWVPLAVVARAQSWSLWRLGRVSLLAAAGHVLTSLVLGVVIAIIGLQFQKQIETQQGHIVGLVLIVTGLGFLVWGLTGHGHAHEHGHDEEREDHEAHEHQHAPGAVTVDASGSHMHEHAHGGARHSHRHSHEAFIRSRAELIVSHTNRGTLLGSLAAIGVPFGVAASPDLTFLPLAIAAGGYGPGAVGAVLVVFAGATLLSFVGLTVTATAIGYQMRGEWFEKNANTITSLVLIAIGVAVFLGL